MKFSFSNHQQQALTRVEVVTVVGLVALAIVFFVCVNGVSNLHVADRINCASNLEDIGLACRIWAGDHEDKYPMSVSVTNGGAKELVATGNVAACFQIMSNELSTTKILKCPADPNTRWATNFTADFNNSRISYFVGLNADEGHRQRLLDGDDNFAIGGTPNESGLLEISTNEEISWTRTRHRWRGGNIGFADGSVAEESQGGMQQAFQGTGLATNRIAIP